MPHTAHRMYGVPRVTDVIKLWSSDLLGTECGRDFGVKKESISGSHRKRKKIQTTQVMSGF